jgi:urate oxidase
VAPKISGTPDLAWNRYGKCRVRVVKVRRAATGAVTGDAQHDLVDLTIDVQLEGEFDPVYTRGDNKACLPTDTMKNTVYAFARQESVADIETFAARLADHFGARPGVTRALVRASQTPWHRITVGGRPHPHAFIHGGAEAWTTTVTRDGQDLEVSSGVTDLVVLKTRGSAFEGYPRDEFTTLPETRDRILATSITAVWTYRRGTSDFSARSRIRSALVETFATHESESVQHTLYAMAKAALAAADEIVEITLALPNRHHLLVDLAPFGLDNPNEIFVATDQPYGLIEATVRRSRP